MRSTGLYGTCVLIIGGALSGNGPATIISESEWEWDGDRRRGLGDYRIPRALISDSNGDPRNRTEYAPNLGKLPEIFRINSLKTDKPC